MERIIKLNEGTRMPVPLQFIALGAPALSAACCPLHFTGSN